MESHGSVFILIHIHFEILCQSRDNNKKTHTIYISPSSHAYLLIIFNIYFLSIIARALGATIFGPHARTFAPQILPRTHFARTCAFHPVAPRTRTRTSK